jgi:hypothetical protein
MVAVPVQLTEFSPMQRSMQAPAELIAVSAAKSYAMANREPPGANGDRRQVLASTAPGPTHAEVYMLPERLRDLAGDGAAGFTKDAHKDHMRRAHGAPQIRRTYSGSADR